jgi:NDP-sugar pyrophosphorylase family protein
MKILIMCGGRGKRLGSLTQKIPKPLVKVNNQVILNVKIDQYLQHGYSDFIFCVGYKGDLIQEAVSKINAEMQVCFSDAGVEAGILERLFAAKDLFKDMVLMSYGDTFTDLNLDKLIESHQNSDNEVTIVTAPIQNPFGLVEYDSGDKVTFLSEKPILNYYIGYAIINKTALDLVPPKVIKMPDGEGLVIFFKILIAMRKLGVYNHSGLQITFNTKEELKDAEEKLVRFYTNLET